MQRNPGFLPRLNCDEDLIARPYEEIVGGLALRDASTAFRFVGSRRPRHPLTNSHSAAAHV